MMKRVWRGGLAIAGALLLAALVAVAQQEDLAQRLDAFVETQTKSAGFSGAVLVAKDGKVVLSKGYGLANAEWDIPNTPQTKFRLGSITKQFTAAAILLLQEQGKLSVQDAVCKYVDPCPAAWQPITVHNLLTHTSGIPNFTSFPDYLPTMTQPSPPEKTLERFRDKPLDFETGSRYSYSNSGYVLLGYILEKVAGVSYDKFVTENVFRPLGMNDTGYDWSTTIIKRRASGYERPGGELQNARYLDMTIPHAAGSLYSTVEDLYKWDRALRDRKLLSAASYQAMFKPFRNNYAYGWIVQERDGRQIIGHGGGINGFATSIQRFPGDDACVVVLTNVPGPASGQVRNALGRMLFGLPAEPPPPPAGERKEITLDTKILDQYVGRYELAPGFTLTVTRQGNLLMVQATGQGSAPVFAESETKFFYRIVDAQITFNKDSQGRVTGLTLHQGGNDMPGRRLPD